MIASFMKPVNNTVISGFFFLLYKNLGPIGHGRNCKAEAFNSKYRRCGIRTSEDVPANVRMNILIPYPLLSGPMFPNDRSIDKRKSNIMWSLGLSQSKQVSVYATYQRKFNSINHWIVSNDSSGPSHGTSCIMRPQTLSHSTHKKCVFLL